MFAGLFVVAMIVMTRFPATPAARWLHLHLVELPLQFASRLKRRDVLMVIILLTAGQSLLMAAPIDIALLYAADLSLYADVMLTAWTLQAAGTVKAGWTSLKARLTRRSARPRSARTRPPRLPANEAASDDGDDPWHAAVSRPLARSGRAG